MGKLDEPGLDALVAAGCTACGGKRLEFRAYLDALLPLIGGEPCGKLSWHYDGEKFVDGVFQVSCPACAKVVFESDICPRCNAAGGLAIALAATNRWAPPTTCASCDEEQVRFIAFVPAKVGYEGKRADKPKTHVELFDPGFHGFRVDCRDCGTVAELTDRCPLCDAPAPLRTRP